MYKPFIEDMSKDFIKKTLNEVRLPVEIAVYGSKNEFNVGGIIRTCHNFLVSKIHLIDIEWFYKKGAMTALQWEKENIVRWETAEQFLEANVDRNIVVFEKRDSIESVDIRTFVYPKFPILVFGSEQTGVPDSILNATKHVVTIPQLGLVNDHNISVAQAIATYDFFLKHSTNREYKL